MSVPLPFLDLRSQNWLIVFVIPISNLFTYPLPAYPARPTYARGRFFRHTFKIQVAPSSDQQNIWQVSFSFSKKDARKDDNANRDILKIFYSINMYSDSNNTKAMGLWIISLTWASVLKGCFSLEIYSLTIPLQFLIPKINK